jgi:hypothetical protein
MAAPATDIVLAAGAVTFTGEWYWNKQLDWKVPLATVILAAAFEGLSNVDRHGATLLSIMVLAGAMSTKFNGHSAFEMVTTLVSGGKSNPKQKTSTTNPPNTAAQHDATANSSTTAVQ